MDDQDEQMRQVYRALRDFLKRSGWTTERIAETIGLPASTTAANAIDTSAEQFAYLTAEHILQLRKAALRVVLQNLAEVRSRAAEERSFAA